MVPGGPAMLARAAVLLVATVAGCAGNLRPAPAPPTEGVMASDDFTISSAAFQDGGQIPAEYTCDGRNASPPLSWSGAPDGTVALALIVDDPDARGFVHWVAYNFGAGSATGSLPAGFSESPDGPAQGTNGFGEEGYGGPCPPSGEHRYEFRLLALDADLPLTGMPSAQQVLDAASGHVLGEARLTARYARAR
jgi:Raf kinase inhibitor-like YbhB/YbcL family protein